MILSQEKLHEVSWSQPIPTSNVVCWPRNSCGGGRYVDCIPTRFGIGEAFSLAGNGVLQFVSKGHVGNGCLLLPLHSRFTFV